jgi:TRAP-type C4-dicarboxylate transport system permease small subunit
MRRILVVLHVIPVVVGTALMLVISGVVFMNIVSRYVFNYGLVWSDELARFSLIWITFVGAAVLVRQGQHIAIDLLVTYLPQWLRFQCFALTQLLTAALGGILIVEGGQQVVRQWVQVSPGLEMNMGLIYLVVPLAGVYMLAYAVANLIGRSEHSKLEE